MYRKGKFTPESQIFAAPATSYHGIEKKQLLTQEHMPHLIYSRGHLCHTLWGKKWRNCICHHCRKRRTIRCTNMLTYCVCHHSLMTQCPSWMPCSCPLETTTRVVIRDIRITSQERHSYEYWWTNQIDKYSNLQVKKGIFLSLLLQPNSAWSI
jgi:hypothetical protein